MVRHYFLADEVYDLLSELSNSGNMQREGLHGPTLDAVEEALDALELVCFDGRDQKKEKEA